MIAKEKPSLVQVQVELFGLARLLAGRDSVTVAVPRRATGADVAATLAEVLPQLVGSVILVDRSGFQPSYTLNVNGTAFVPIGPTELPLNLNENDSILVFSSQAGG